jgi:hypothetical protein
MRRVPHDLVRRTAPTERPEVFDLYWTFASRRHDAFEARLSGGAWPWSDDPILQTFKFCNVFRALDRVSQYLIGEVAYRDDAMTTPLDRIFQLVAFRTFSKIETWHEVSATLGGVPRLEHLRYGAFEKALDEVKTKTGGLYTGAFILCANKAFGFDEKHRNHVALFRHMFVDNAFAERALNAPNFPGSLWSVVVGVLPRVPPPEGPLQFSLGAYRTALCIKEPGALHTLFRSDPLTSRPAVLQKWGRIISMTTRAAVGRVKRNPDRVFFGRPPRCGWQVKQWSTMVVAHLA